MQYSIVGNEDGEANITVFADGQVHVAHSSHPNFEKIREGILSGNPTVLDLFDVAEAAATKFQRLTERITTANGRLYFDGVEVNNALAGQVVRFLNDDVEDWRPLVAFFDNVQQNPEEHSREQLYDWLSKHEFTITNEGMIVGYKGVRNLDDGFESINSGRALVNGEAQNGRIKQNVGDIVEMPRDQVAFDPSVGCSTGLHVGNYRYANSFAQGALLEVHVNPRDVVSVPTESNWEKVRVCRYTVVGTLDAEYTTPVRWTDDYQDEYGEDPYDDYTDYDYGDDNNDYDKYGRDDYVFFCDVCSREIPEEHLHDKQDRCVCDEHYSDTLSDASTDTQQVDVDDDQVSNFEWGF